jgi:hypothetical protein
LYYKELTKNNGDPAGNFFEKIAKKRFTKRKKGGIILKTFAERDESDQGGFYGA